MIDEERKELDSEARDIAEEDKGFHKRSVGLLCEL
jgi:hypothetical protein